MATSDKTLCNKVFNIAKNLKYDGYEPRFATMVSKGFDKKLLTMVLKMIIYQNND